MPAIKKIGIFTTLLLTGLLALPVLGQTDNGGGGGGGGGGGNPPPADNGGGGGGGGGGRGGGRGAFNPQRMMDRMKTALGATDDEFAVIQPKLEAVMEARRDAMVGGFGFGGRRPRQDDANPSTQPTSPVQDAIADLRATLDDKTTTPDQIRTKLDALRKARDGARANLAKAQQDLKDLLTQRQEAQLVIMGMLD